MGSSYRILFLVTLTSFISGLVRSDIYVTLMCNFEVHYQHELFYILKHIWHALPQQQYMDVK